MVDPDNIQALTKAGNSSVLTDTVKTATLSAPGQTFSPAAMNVVTKDGNDTLFSSNYTGSTKTWESITAEGKTSKSSINQFEQMTMSQTGTLKPVLYTYNNDGKIIKITQGDRVTNLNYDWRGYLIQTVNAIGKTTDYSKDNMGRTTTEIRPGNLITKFSYDQNGRMINLTTPNNKYHQFIYNEMELLGEYLPPQVTMESGKTSYEYNLDKELTKVTLPDGRELNYYYTTEGKMNHLSVYGETDLYFDYSNSINPHSPYSILNTSSLRLNRTFAGPYITSESQVETVGDALIAKIQFGLDSKFRHSKITVTDSANNISYTPYFFYDKDSKLRQAGALSIKRESNQGQISELQLDKAKINYSFDPDYGELTKIQYKFNGVNGLLQNFKRDKLGRISQMTYESGESVIHYDEAGRFTGRSQVGSNKPYSSFIYDKNGNRIRGYEDERTFTAEYDNQDRLIKYNKTTYGYNLNGDRAWKLEGTKYTNYTFDAFGNLTQVQLPEKQINYLYDGLNRRVAKKEWGNITTRFIWQDQLRVAAELNANGTFRKQFIYADSVNSPEYMFYNGKKYLFVKDHRGSILQVVDSASGEIMQKMKYSEFGEVLLDTNPGFQPFGFAGGFYDYETKLVRFGARDYDASIGRWLSKDPILFAGGDTNLFGYVLNDPVNFFDPTGLIRNPGDILDEALDHTNSSSGTSGAGNAFQHCFASCMMTAENGAFASFIAGHGFEAVNGMKGQSKADWAMDVSNNAKGRNLGGKCPINNWDMDNEKSKGISNYCANSCQNAGLTFMSM